MCRADHFGRRKDEKNPRQLAPLFKIGAALGLSKHDSECTQQRAMAKISAAMVVAGYDEFLPVCMAFMLKHDEEWKRFGPGRPPKDHIEYLKWHRNRDEAERLSLEAKARAKARAESINAIREEEARHRAIEESLRKRDVVRVSPAVVPGVLFYTAEERRQAIIESRARARAKIAKAKAKARAKKLAKEAAIEAKAFALFDLVCGVLGADRTRVFGPGRTPYLCYVRQVYTMVARDTAYCGGQPSYPTLAVVIGRPAAHSTAMMAHRRGLLSYEAVLGVGNVCRALGIEPPPYAVAAKGGGDGGGDCGAGREGGEGWTLNRR